MARARLDVLAFALAGGVLWGAAMALLALMAAGGWGGALVAVLGSVYLGYAPGIPGAALGAAWGFADGAVGWGVFALLYNGFAAMLDRRASHGARAGSAAPRPRAP